MSDLKANFEQAAVDVTQLPKKPGNDTLLKLYALYKQGMEGDCSGGRPGMFSPVKRAKYDAWAEKKGMSQADAQQAYIDLVKSLQG